MGYNHRLGPIAAGALGPQVIANRESDAGAPGRSTYRPSLSNTWWLRSRRYFLIMVRDLTPVPIGLWLIWLLVQVARLRSGPSGFSASASPRFVAFSVVCLGFALLHSVTWLQLSGVILRVSFGGREIDPRLVTAVNFMIWIGATVVIGAILIWLGR